MDYNNDDESEKEMLEEELQELEEVFYMYATAKYEYQGAKEPIQILSVRDLSPSLKDLGFVVTEAEVFEIIDEVDPDKTEFINFEKFAYIVKKINKIMSEEDLIAAFSIFDIDGNGHISTQEIKNITRYLGMLYSEDEVEDMMREVDSDGDGRISFDDFAYFMTKY